MTDETMALRCYSVWQPYAHLLIKGFKLNETRSTPAPKSLIGQRIGIASTLQLKPEQLKATASRTFKRHYKATGLIWKDWGSLPRGYLLGTVRLVGCVQMTKSFIRKQTAMERAFGNWKVGNYAWLVEAPIEWSAPVRVRGAQGVWIYDPTAQDRAG
jgi:hypothetical protein